jgi:hypothetical protein
MPKRGKIEERARGGYRNNEKQWSRKRKREEREVKRKKRKKAFNSRFWAFLRGFVQGRGNGARGKRGEFRKNNSKKGHFLAIYWKNCNRQ